MFVWFIFNAYIIELTLLRSGLILIIGSPIHSSIANVIHMYINIQSKANLRLNHIYSLNPLHSPIGPYLQSYIIASLSGSQSVLDLRSPSVSQPYRSIGVSVSSAPAYRFPLPEAHLPCHYITSRFSIGIWPPSVSQPYRSLGVSVSSAPAYRFPLAGHFSSIFTI